MSEQQLPSPDEDELERIQTRIADTNESAAKAVSKAAGLVARPSPGSAIWGAHADLLRTYKDLVRAIEICEKVIDNNELHGGPTPKQLCDEHLDRLKEQYDEPVFYVACEIMKHNRREWLYRRPKTQGAQSVERHGLTANQRSMLNKLQDAWREYDQNDDALVLQEDCQECPWSDTWTGGTADEDPAVRHARETGHEVHSTPEEDADE